MGLSEPQIRPGSNLHGGISFAPQPYRQQSWYEAYMAALFEADRKQISERIKSAEQLILKREQEIALYSSVEHQALNNALHALRALSGCLRL
jgi:hypothetical protein